MLLKKNVRNNLKITKVTRKKEIKFKRKSKLIFKKDVILLLLSRLKEKNIMLLLRPIENVRKQNVRRRFKKKETKDFTNVSKLNLN